MGTRGTFGFRIDGTDKLQYKHFDSYPTGMTELDDWLKTKPNWDTVREQARALKVVSEKPYPTPEEIEACQKYLNLEVGTRSETDWYCLLRECQGNPEKILECGYILDAGGFLKDSLFCEWGYIINLDTMKLEVYKGFQDAPHNLGRYASLKIEGDEYYPCALVTEFPLDDMPEDWMSLEKELRG